MVGTIGAEALASRVVAKRIRWRAQTLAKRLGLTAKERHALRITTIGAIDETPEERIEARRHHAKQRKLDLRRDQGAQPRTQYEANSIRRTKPWVSLGMSRAAWYRAGKPTPEQVRPKHKLSPICCSRTCLTAVATPPRSPPRALRPPEESLRSHS